MASNATIMPSRAALVGACREPGSVVFVDAARLPEAEALAFSAPIVLVTDTTLPRSVRWLWDYPWLSHIVSVTTLSGPTGRVHLSALLHNLRPQITCPQLLGFVGSSVTGRKATLLRSSQRMQ